MAVTLATPGCFPSSADTPGIESRRASNDLTNNGVQLPSFREEETEAQDMEAAQPNHIYNYGKAHTGSFPLRLSLEATSMPLACFREILHVKIFRFGSGVNKLLF